jgi:hypothetical protein
MVAAVDMAMLLHGGAELAEKRAPGRDMGAR